MYRFGITIIVILMMAGLAGFWISTNMAGTAITSPTLTHAPTLPTVTILDPQLGSATAATTIIEFADFTCPHCRDADIILRELVAKHPTDIRIVWKDFPNNTNDPLATVIAYGGRCAQKVGAFEKFRDWAFTNQGTITQDMLTAYLKTIGITNPDQCLADPGIQAKVQNTQSEGLNLRIDGTPYLLINNQTYTGEISVEALESLLPKK